jgi:hypothetical protein
MTNYPSCRNGGFRLGQVSLCRSSCLVASIECYFNFVLWFGRRWEGIFDELIVELTFAYAYVFVNDGFYSDNAQTNPERTTILYIYMCEEPDVWLSTSFDPNSVST